MITLGDNFSYQGAKPLDARLVYSTVASMKAVADSTMYDGCLAYCTATDKTYQWKSTNAVDETTGKWREFTSGGDTIQVSSMPTASASELGKVYQYIGSTTSTLTHGYFYECVSDGESTPTYSWSQVEVSKGGHDIKNNGVAVTSRDTMNFTDFDIADDSTNEETDIKAHRLTASELTDICSPLPSAVSDMPVLFDERETEYVVGWYVLANGTKKPVYQKSIAFSTSTYSDDGSRRIYALCTLSNVDKFLSRYAFIDRGDGYFIDNVGISNTLGTQYVLYGIKDLSNSAKVNFAGDKSVMSTLGTTVSGIVVITYTKTTDTPS